MLKQYFVFCIYITVQVSINVVSSNDELQVAFFCGRPSNILKNKQWVLDFQQNCIKTESEVVAYCQKSFPTYKIQTAEPAIQKIKFKHWCDFNNQNCDVDVKIRPFKCLDKNFQSDALILPRNCQFGHLLNQSECLNYKIWVDRAKIQCFKQRDWNLKSSGMLFPCGESETHIKPMYFKGVEFVCCPKYEPKEAEFSDVHIYKNYLNNAVLETEEGEQKIYEDAGKTLVQLEKERESNMIKEFKESENSFKNLWNTDPERAKKKEKDLISQFKIVYQAIQDQFLDNKKQLLTFHDDRLEFIFNTKFTAMLHSLQQILDKPDRTEKEVYETMKICLTIINDRKRYLLSELEEAKRIRPSLEKQMNNKINSINKDIEKLFDKLDQIPEIKPVIKQKLVDYFANVYPEKSKPIGMKHRIYNNDERENFNDIIANYIHRPETPKSNKNNGVVIHYDLGLDDKDQLGHYAKEGVSSQEETHKKIFGKKFLFGLIFVTTFLAMIVVLSGIFIYRHKNRTIGYSKPKFQNDKNLKGIYGFGVFNSDNSLKSNFANGYENLTYMATSHLGKPVDGIVEEQTEIKGGEKPLIPTNQ